MMLTWTIVGYKKFCKLSLHPETFFPEQFSLYSLHILINIILKQECLLAFMFRCNYFFLFFWIRTAQETQNKTPKFRETFHFLLISQRKYKLKVRTYYWVQYIKIISEKKSLDIVNWKLLFSLWQILPASQKCEEAFHILFRSSNYSKYTRGFYIHYHSEAFQVLSFSSFVKKTLKNLLFLQYSIRA